MDKKRAVEIFKSLGVIDVNYKGDYVWIEDININDEQVKVRDLETNKEFIVNTKELKED